MGQLNLTGWDISVSIYHIDKEQTQHLSEFDP